MVRKKLIRAMFIISVGLFSNVIQASPEGFITIIGPDGFPMVVPHPEQKKQSPLKERGVSVATEKKTVSSDEKNVGMEKSKPIIEPKVANIPPSIIIKPSTEQPKPSTQTVVSKVNDAEKTHPLNLSETVKVPLKAVVDTQVGEPKKIELAQPYQEIGGEKYYDSEYLETKEFNLDNKTRFYQIPNASGGSSFDVIERNKGVDMSWFNLRNEQNKSFPETIVLGEHYKVLPKNALDQALPQSCMTTKALKKAKKFDKDILSLWPRAPFKDEFDFELISLQDRVLKNLRLSSYAKSDKDRTFYWPLVVFLDEKGCTIEGASGYFTQAYPATPLQTEALEGNLQIPVGSKYILLTALVEAIDLPNKILSNQGQVKLTVLR